MPPKQSRCRAHDDNGKIARKRPLRNQNRARKQETATSLRAKDVLEQYYTKPAVIDDIVTPCVLKHMPKDGVLVDFSCGDNRFARNLSEHAATVASYDIAPTEDAIASGAVQKDWFDVGSIPHNASIGLNPPFGYRGNLAQEFIDHALEISSPSFLFLILPIREWNVPSFVAVEKIKLPLEAFMYPSGETFAYPCHLYVFKRSSTTSTETVVPARSLPPSFVLKTHERCVDLTKTILLVRRVGYYTGRQFYFVLDDVVYYYHKNELHVGQSWNQNAHNIDNSFWVVYFPVVCITVTQLRSTADAMIRYMEEHAVTTREEDVKRALSINRARLENMLLSSLPEEILEAGYFTAPVDKKNRTMKNWPIRSGRGRGVPGWPGGGSIGQLAASAPIPQPPPPAQQPIAQPMPPSMSAPIDNSASDDESIDYESNDDDSSFTVTANVRKNVMHGGACERLIDERLLRDLAEQAKNPKRPTSEEVEHYFNRRRLELIDDITVETSEAMEKIRQDLLRHGKVLVDVPYDGSCGIWSVMPAVSASLGRPTTKQEVRRLLVNELRAPEFRRDLECDMRNGHETSVDELLRTLAKSDQFVPPELLLRATERFTGGRIRMWAHDSTVGTQPLLWSDGDSEIPFSCEFVHIPFTASTKNSSERQFAPEEERSGGHIARVLSLPTTTNRPIAAEKPAMTGMSTAKRAPLPLSLFKQPTKKLRGASASAAVLQRVLERLEHDRQLTKRMRASN